MTTMSHNRADDHAIWVGVAKGLGILAGFVIVGGIVYFWLITVAGLVLGFVSARNASSRRSELPRD
jgi:hypothetical protein